MTMRGVTVLVTGADGFIGSHLVERLAREGAKVRAVCMYNSHGSVGWLDDLPKDLRHDLDIRLGDIRDAEWMSRACAKVEIVFHLAALIAIPYSYTAARSVLETNVLGTLNVLEAVRANGVRRMIHTSTSEVYGTPASLPIRETHPLNAQSPYAASKVAADQLALSYHRSHGVPVGTLRPFNTYGPRQSLRAVLPAILAQLIAGKRRIALGRTDPRRDLTFVTDTVDGFVRMATCDDMVGQVVQLGTGQAVSIAELFDLACRVLDARADVLVDEKRLRPDASEVLVLQSDPSRAKVLLGWTPTVTLADGIARTAEWIREDPRRYAGDSFQL
jgi:UDP-glucose 4-epimerase